MKLNVNGFDIEAEYENRFVKQELMPLLDRMRQLREAKGRRIIVFLSAPPGAGKSTLAAYLELLAPGEVKALGMDGFHYPNDYLRTHVTQRNGREIPLSEIKGSPETFDVEALTQKLTAVRKGENVLFPIYDRRIHEPRMNTVPADGEILCLEGNWLLLGEEPWDGVRLLADLTVRLEADEKTLKERLIRRKMRGGLTEEKAADWYKNVDSINVKRYFDNTGASDIVLRP